MILLRVLLRLIFRFSFVAILALVVLAITGPILPKDGEQLRNLATAHECVTGIGLASRAGPLATLPAFLTPQCGETLASGGWQAYWFSQCVLRYPVVVCMGLD